jgi:hypothetical protein
VAVVLTLVQTKQRRKNIFYINETIQKQSTNNTKHSKYKYTYYQNTPTYIYPHITKQVKTTRPQMGQKFTGIKQIIIKINKLA